MGRNREEGGDMMIKERKREDMRREDGRRRTEKEEGRRVEIVRRESKNKRKIK